MDPADWRAQLEPDCRQRQLNEIMSVLKMQHPFVGEDKLVEIEKLSHSFEHKAFAGATSQGVYLERISLMILSILDANDWRVLLQPDSRQRVVNKMVDTLQIYLPHSGPDGLDKHRRYAERYEERIYNIATSRADYLRKISLKLLSVEMINHKDIVANSLASNPGCKIAMELQLLFFSQS